MPLTLKVWFLPDTEGNPKVGVDHVSRLYHNEVVHRSEPDLLE